MALVKYLAEIWGISLVVIPLALLIKESYLKRLFMEVDNDITMFFWGAVSIVIGLAMLLSYGVWSHTWKVTITILGWLVFLKGLFILFLPEQIRKWAKDIEGKNWLPTVLVAFVFAGLIITYFGFTA